MGKRREGNPLKNKFRVVPALSPVPKSKSPQSGDANDNSKTYRLSILVNFNSGKGLCVLKSDVCTYTEGKVVPCLNKHHAMKTYPCLIKHHAIHTHTDHSEDVGVYGNEKIILE
jgi:hypothetical protein